MHLQYKAFPAEVETGPEAEPGTFKGRASVFHVLDSYNEIVAPGAFAKTLPNFLARVIRSQHAVSIGRPTAAAETAEALEVSGRISDTVQGRDDLTLLRDGVIRSLSIGFRPAASTVLTGAREVSAYWSKAGYTPSPDEEARAKDGARVLTEINLLEVSLVDLPANPDCTISEVKAPLISLADLLARARDEADQVKAGRVLSGANRSRLASMSGALRTAADDLDALLAETDPSKLLDLSAEFRRQHLTFIRAAARRLGILSPVS